MTPISPFHLPPLPFSLLLSRNSSFSSLFNSFSFTATTSTNFQNRFSTIKKQEIRLMTMIPTEDQLQNLVIIGIFIL